MALEPWDIFIVWCAVPVIATCVFGLSALRTLRRDAEVLRRGRRRLDGVREENEKKRNVATQTTRDVSTQTPTPAERNQTRQTMVSSREHEVIHERVDLNTDRPDLNTESLRRPGQGGQRHRMATEPMRRSSPGGVQESRPKDHTSGSTESSRASGEKVMPKKVRRATLEPMPSSGPNTLAPAASRAAEESDGAGMESAHPPESVTLTPSQMRILRQRRQIHLWQGANQTPS